MHRVDAHKAGTALMVGGSAYANGVTHRACRGEVRALRLIADALAQVVQVRDRERGQALIARVDATPDALMLMKEGKLDVTVFQDAYGQGYGGIEAAIKAAKGEKLPKTWDIPYEVVTPDKVDIYLAKWGL